MAKISPMYHVCREQYKAGDTIPAGDNSYQDRLTPPQKAMEDAIRARSPDVGKIRDTCVYTYENRRQAVGHRRAKQARLRHRLRLYEVEIDTADLLYVADLNHWTDGREAFKKGQSLDDAVNGYLSGLAAEGRDKTRWEFLARRVVVIEEIEPH